MQSSDMINASNRSGSKTFYWWIIAGLLVATAASWLLATSVLTPQHLRTLISEGGLVEDGSVVGYAACILVLALTGDIGKGRETLLLCVAPFLLALRELDFHVRFTTMGVFKTKFYVSPDVPWLEKFIVVTILGLIAWAAIVLIVTFAARFVTAVRDMHPGAVSVCLAFVLLAISKTIDGADRKAVELGTTASEHTIIVLQALEEILECAAPVFLVAAATTRIYLAVRRATNPA